MNETLPTMIEANGVTKVFRDFWHRPKVAAVNDLSFSVKRGEVFGLLGPNGSGKSTTIKMILGLLYPTKGALSVMNQSPRDVRTKERIGYLPEESYLYPYLTSRESLDFFGRLFDLNKNERNERTTQLLEMIGLQHAGNRVIGEFSKGMMRRIGIAQALINDPDLIILDEPTSGLDPIGCRQVKDLILTLAARGKTILMTSHLLSDVEDVCDRVLILYNGKLQATGTIDELLQDTQRYRVTLPEATSGEQLSSLTAQIAETTGQEPTVDHPRRNLEQFFLDVVQRARTESSDASGVGTDKGVADYLSKSADSQQETAPTNDTASIDDRLSRLVKDSNDES